MILISQELPSVMLFYIKKEEEILYISLGWIKSIYCNRADISVEIKIKFVFLVRKKKSENQLLDAIKYIRIILSPHKK